MTPNKDALREWVVALLSGEFEQGRGRLKLIGIDGQPDEYCCLGVACEIFAERLNLKKEIKHYFNITYAFYNDHAWALPMAVSHYLGVNEYMPVIAGRLVTELNDILEWDFYKIACAINSTYELDMDIPDPDLV